MAVCPSPPLWRPITGRPPKGVSRAANQAIEQAYREAKPDHDTLFGPDFELGFWGDRSQTELRLSPNSPNMEFGNVLLKELRGPRGGPRKPDIADFVDRAFYEIKPIATFALRRDETIRQHVSLYEMARSIVDQYNNDVRARTPMGSRTLRLQGEWRIENSQWRPPQCLDLPGLDGQYKLDTYATDYTTDPRCRGIIIYRVWKKVRRRDQEETQAVSVTVDNRDKKYDKLIPDAATLLKAVGRFDADEPEFVIIVPKSIDDITDKQTLVDVSKAAQGGQRQPAAPKPSMVSTITTAVKEHPYLTAGVVLAVAVTGVGLFVYLGAAAATAAAVGGGELLAEGAGATAVAAGGAEMTGGAEIISLAARRALVQGGAASASGGASMAASLAASVLMVFGVVKGAKADDVSFSNVDTMKLVPASVFSPYQSTYSGLSTGLSISDPPDHFSTIAKDLDVGDVVMFDSKPHVIIGTLTAYPNNLGSEDPDE